MPDSVSDCFLKLLLGNTVITNISIKNDESRYDATIEITDQESCKITSKLIGKKQTFFISAFVKNDNLYFTTFYQHSSLTTFQLILQLVLNRLLADNHGFILHSSAIIHRKKVYIFAGQSGSGKSTVLKLLDNSYKPFTDDNLIVRKQNGVFYCFQAPLNIKENLIIKNQKAYDVGEIFFLNKSKKNKLEKISNYEAVKQFLKIIKFKKNSSKQIKTALKFISANDIFYNLYFSKNTDQLTKTLKKVT